MLLILMFIHALAKKAEAKHSGDAPSFRSTSDICDCSIANYRRLFDIVWACLATIFACTWAAVHPNVPPPHTSRPGLLVRRLRLMLVAVIAPEVMVDFAARQLLAARLFSREFDISITHGFFICMGGFVTKDPSTGRPGYAIVTREQLSKHPEYLAVIQEVKAADIDDKSKGDALSKGVALVQGVWFIAQCIARFAQRLPVTELEIATLAFAAVNVFVWSLWWNKPLDVQEPIPIGPMKEVPATVGAAPRLDVWDRFGSMLAGDYGEYDSLSSDSVPSFWSDCEDETRKYPFFAELLVGTVFGAIHCLAWNANFTSSVEMWMWRSSALVVAGIPFLTIFWLVILSQWDALLGYTFISSIFAYILGRLFLLILPFTALRALPAGAFVDVDWSVYIPHL